MWEHNRPWAENWFVGNDLLRLDLRIPAMVQKPVMTPDQVRMLSAAPQINDA